MDSRTQVEQRRMGKALRFGLAIAAGVAALLHTASARADVVYKPLAQLATEADRIVIADVFQIDSNWAMDQVGIKTIARLAVSDDLKGGGDPIIELPLPGGTVGDLTAFTSDSPTFAVGDHVLLFLAGDPYRIVGAYQGAYLTDGVDAVQTDGGPPAVDETTRRSLESLITGIAAALPPGTVPFAINAYQGDFQLPGAMRWVPLQCNWTYMPLPMGESYRINTNCMGTTCGSTSQQISAIRTGPTAWEAVGTNLHFTYGGTTTTSQSTFDNQNTVYFDQSASLGPEVVARTTYWCYQSIRMVEWDIAFNDHDFNFWGGQGASCPAGTYDMKGIATHEFGHSLGLGHTSVTTATMFGGTSPCNDPQRSLEQDDRDGIIAIYGICGNGLVEGSEQCDDHGLVPGDGCSPQCRFEPFTGNNACANAILVTDGVYNFDTSAATTDGPDEPDICKFANDSQLNHDVWFRYHATCTGNASIRLCGSSFDTKLAVYAGWSCPTASSAIMCNDDSTLCSPGNLQSALSVSMVSGQDYLIRIGGYQDEVGLGTLTIEGPICPSNDDCANLLPVENGQTFFDTRGATTDGPNEPGACNFFNFPQVGQDIWYCYESTCTGVVTVDLCGSLYDTKIAAYNGCECPDAESSIACNDDSCGYQSRVTFPANVNNSYLLRIGGFQAETGAGSMVISCTTVQCLSPSDCDDGDPCTQDMCTNWTCQYSSMNSGACDDGDPCTVHDSCSGGTCTGGLPLHCDDGLFCNGQEVCWDGACVAGNPPCGQGSWCDEEEEMCIYVGPTPCDGDQDGDVDLIDYRELQHCMGHYADPKCQIFDLTGEGGVVEWSDCREFLQRMNGPGVP